MSYQGERQGGPMEKSIFGFILKYSLRGQLVVLAITALSWPVLYMTLELPKRIVNEGIGGEKQWASDLLGFGGGGKFDKPTEEPDQILFLLILCFIFLGLVVANGVIKYFLNVYAGRLGERMLRRLRYQLYARVLRFPLPHFKKVGQGEIIPMITAEVEPLGGFIGIAMSTPLFFGGMLLVYLGFIFAQDFWLGLAAIALYPIQGYIIPKLQKKVVELGRQRVREVRSLADKIGDTVSGVTEVHAHDASAYERADITRRLDRIYNIRYEIFRRKFAIKFINNFLAQLTPFFFYSIGGYLVIKGQLSFGALVAVLAAYKDLNAPWKELLNYYQLQADVRVKYEQVVEQFDPPHMLDEDLQLTDEDRRLDLEGEIAAANLSYTEDGRTKAIEGVNFSIDLDSHVAIVGHGGSGKEELAMLLARLLQPTGGTLRLAGERMVELPEAVTGRQLAYTSASPHLFATTLRDNLTYGLKHRPTHEPERDGEEAARHRQYVVDAELAGNSRDDPHADWIDYASAGVDGRAALDARAIEVLHMVGLSQDVYQLGLRGQIDPAAEPELARRFLEARQALRQRLDEAGMAELVEPFDPDRYNDNATLGENLLFGTPRDSTFDVERLAEHPYVLEVLERAGLIEDLYEIGRQVAETMVELFSGLPPGHEFFEQYSFIGSDELQDYQALLTRTAGKPLDELSTEDRDRLLSLPFKLIPARHRLGMITDDIKARLLDARRLFAENLPEDLRDKVEFFDAGKYNGASSVQDNLLFGKIAYGQAQAVQKLRHEIGEVLDALDLRSQVIMVGLDYNVGVGGARLSAAQRQKASIARCVLKRPDLFVLNEAVTSMDSPTQNDIADAILAEFEDRGVIWSLHRTALAAKFDRVLVMRGGQIVEQGTFQELDTEGSVLRQLLDAEKG